MFGEPRINESHTTIKISMKIVRVYNKKCRWHKFWTTALDFDMLAGNLKLNSWNFKFNSWILCALLCSYQFGFHL